MILGANMIRKLQRKDVPRVAEIQVFGWRSAFRGMLSDELLFNERTVEKLMTFWHAKVDKNCPDVNDYVFVEDNMVKGIVTCGKCRDKDKKHAYELWGLYVEPLMKGGGIGTKLVEYCENEARKNGCIEFCLWALEENIAAIEFYTKKLGYVLDGARAIRPPVNTNYQLRMVKKLI